MHRLLLLAGTFLGGAVAVPTLSKSSLIDQHPFVSKAHQDKDEFDLEPTAKYAFAGITSFAQLPTAQCLTTEGPVDDILLVGFPFDTATSYRTGTRFGPNAIRQGSRALSLAYVVLYLQHPFLLKHS